MKKFSINFAKLLLIMISFFIITSHPTQAVVYTILTSTETVDGTNFCGGSACTSVDTIIIQGGARGNLRLQNFNGNGSYITITNENKTPDSRVVITGDMTGGWGIVSITNCKYIEIRGDNDPDITYGIKVSSSNYTQSNYKPGDVFVYGHSDHIKLSYIETDDTGNTSNASDGFQINDATLTSSDAFSDIEIHHNYVHNSRYCGMYLGHNEPDTDNKPYVNSFSVHDNILENMGGYGITFKGSSSGTTNIYNNTVKITGLVRDDLTGVYKQGIGTGYLFNSGTTVNIYDNWVEKTKGNGIRVINCGDTHPTVNILTNTIVGCGTGDETNYGHGVSLETYVLCDVNVYDNIIVKPTRYGLFAGGSTIGNCNRNLIGGGLGERVETGDGVWNEGIGADANIYHANIADFGFTTWSDDNDYSNDNFTILGNDTIAPITPTGLAVN